MTLISTIHFGVNIDLKILANLVIMDHGALEEGKEGIPLQNRCLLIAGQCTWLKKILRHSHNAITP